MPRLLDRHRTRPVVTARNRGYRPDTPAKGLEFWLRFLSYRSNYELATIRSVWIQAAARSTSDVDLQKWTYLAELAHIVPPNLTREAVAAIVKDLS